MNILTVSGNMVTLVYNPARDHVEVGDSIAIIDRDENRGVLVQIIATHIPELPGILLEVIRREALSEESYTYGLREAETYKRAVERMKYAEARIIMEVRRVDNRLVYERWSGYVPSRNAEFIRVSAGEVINALRRRRAQT